MDLDVQTSRQNSRDISGDVLSMKLSVGKGIKTSLLFFRFELISIVGILASSVLSLPLSRHNPSCKQNAQSHWMSFWPLYSLLFFVLFSHFGFRVRGVMISGTYKEEDRVSRKKRETGHETKRENVD